MKKITSIFALTLFISIFLSACTQKPEDIKISELEKVCDYLEAMEKVIDAGIKTKGEKKSSELSEAESDYLKVLKKKMEEIGESATKKFTEAEIKECSQFESVKQKIDVFDDLGSAVQAEAAEQ